MAPASVGVAMPLIIETMMISGIMRGTTAARLACMTAGKDRSMSLRLEAACGSAATSSICITPISMPGMTQAANMAPMDMPVAAPKTMMTREGGTIGPTIDEAAVTAAA